MGGTLLDAWAQALDGRRRTFDRTTLSWLLHASLGRSGERVGARGSYPVWCNPTSGNLHTVEADVGVRGGELDGLYRYDSVAHGLGRLARLEAGDEPTTSVLVGLSLVYGRQIARYGLRGVRYAWIDLGHAIGALDVAAGSLGWSIEPARCPRLEEALGWQTPTLGPFGRRRGELLRLSFGRRARAHRRVVLETFPRPTADGPEIDFERARSWISASEASLRPTRLPSPTVNPALAHRQRRRRSAPAFVASGEVPRAAFASLLRALSTTRTLEALVLVHRVAGIVPGAYWWRRREPHDDGVFSPIVLDDLGDLAVGLHGYQRSAHDQAFSITFGLRLEEELPRAGVRRYREAHVEAGCAAQRLYLAAQAHDLPVTGIGALLDDDVTALPGLQGWSPIYSFAGGSAAAHGPKG
jgi:nitroreductase